MTTLRSPVAPRRFLVRLVWAELLLAALQLFHLSVIALGNADDYVAWAAVHGIAQASLWLLRRSAAKSQRFPHIPWQPLLWLLALTCSVKLFSRTPYITAWLAEGLQGARQMASDQAIESGASSYLNIFFYPLAILCATATMPRAAYRWSALAVLVISLVDMIFIGTRNAPVFVLLFHVLLVPVRIRGRQLVSLATLLAAFIGIFGYSTVNRTADAAAGSFDWLVLFEFTKSSEVLRLDPKVVEPLAERAPAVLPAVFLSHYLSHPVAELAYLSQQLPQLQTGDAYHLKYQLCVVRVCSQADAFEGIERVNPRAGVYQTIWGSLLLDFGTGGALLAWFAVIGLVMVGQSLRPRTLSLGVAIIATVIMLSGIENYLFNGLGLLQVLCVFVAFWGIRLWHGLRAPLPARPLSARPSPH